MIPEILVFATPFKTGIFRLQPFRLLKCLGKLLGVWRTVHIQVAMKYQMRSILRNATTSFPPYVLHCTTQSLASMSTGIRYRKYCIISYLPRFSLKHSLALIILPTYLKAGLETTIYPPTSKLTVLPFFHQSRCFHFIGLYILLVFR